MVATDTTEPEIRRVVAEPPHIRQLALDRAEGVRVPWFAAGQSYGRRPPLATHPMQPRALAGKRCWLCGHTRTASQNTFLLTLEGALRREAFEPPSHWACAQYAALAWLPGGRLGWFFAPEDRRLAWLQDPEDDWRGRQADQIVCLWQCKDFVVGARSIGVFEPRKTRWYCHGDEMASVAVTRATEAAANADELIARLRPWLP